MKKLFILFLIIINLLTLYFFVFPYQSFSTYNSLQEVDKALTTQRQLIVTSSENRIRDIRNNVYAYPIFKSKEDFAKKSHEVIKEIRDELEILKDAVDEQLFERYDSYTFHNEQPNDFWFRIQPFHYQAPKSALFKTDVLAKAMAAIDGSQKRILNDLNNEDFRQLLIDSFFIDTEALPGLFTGKSFMETIVIINKLKTQNTVTESKIINHIYENIKSQIAINQLQLNGYVPLVSVRNAKIKKGEIFKAEIFTAPIMTHDSLQFYINNDLVPKKNGIANYEYQPTSSGIELFHVTVELNNSFYQGSQTYKKAFELYVADCD